MSKQEGSPSITVQPHQVLERILSIEIVRVTERAAVSAARLRGRGAEKASDQAAVDAMRRELNNLPIHGVVVIGEGELDEAPMLFIGEEVGTRRGPKVDIAVDPLEGTTLCAKNMPGAIATVAIAEEGTLLHAPDVYMEKIAIGPGYPKGVVDLDAPARRQHPQTGQGQGCAVLMHITAHHSRPAAPCRHDRGRAQGGRVGVPDHRWRCCGRHPYGRSRHRPASTSIWASAARPKACWRLRRCAASAARCSAGSCSTPTSGASAPPRWASSIRASAMRSRTWCGATACLRRPA